MEPYLLKVFLTVVNEKSFSRAAERLGRTQPAVSLAISKLESDLGERLLDRSGKNLMVTDAGRIVLDFARRFEHLSSDMDNALAELRDNSAGRLIIGANESTTLYLLKHITQYRRRYPKVKVQVRRSVSSAIPGEIIDGTLELGVISYDPEDERLSSQVIFKDHLAFVVSPEHRFASLDEVPLTELGMETFIAHNVLSPYRAFVVREFQKRKVPLNMDLEMPTVETIRKLVQRNEGVAFLPRMCVEPELQMGTLREVRVPELQLDRNVRLVYPARRGLSHAAKAFLDLVTEQPQESSQPPSRPV